MSSPIASDPPTPRREPLLPAAPALVAGTVTAVWLDTEGEVESLTLPQAAARAQQTAPFICHAGVTAARLGLTHIDAYDLLELFAFVRPAYFAVPSPRGLAEAMSLALPDTPESEALVLLAVAHGLLAELTARQFDRSGRDIARVMTESGWRWGPAVLAAFEPARPQSAGRTSRAGVALNVWDRLPEWEDEAPAPPPGRPPSSAEETRRRPRLIPLRKAA